MTLIIAEKPELGRAIAAALPGSGRTEQSVIYKGEYAVIPAYDIWHMMIDESAQGHGYGSAALDQVIEYIRTKPFGTSGRVRPDLQQGQYGRQKAV